MDAWHVALGAAAAVDVCLAKELKSKATSRLLARIMRILKYQNRRLTALSCAYLVLNPIDSRNSVVEIPTFHCITRHKSLNCKHTNKQIKRQA